MDEALQVMKGMLSSFADSSYSQRPCVKFLAERGSCCGCWARVREVGLVLFSDGFLC